MIDFTFHKLRKLTLLCEKLTQILKKLSYKNAKSLKQLQK